MIQLNVLPLDSGPANYLKRWQKEIDDLPDYADQVEQGKSKFGGRNTNQNVTFKHVKKILTQMCQGARRCGYCEDSVADEVEHIKPKDLYPGDVFSWDNYLYACGPCNGPKNNKFAVLRGSPLSLVDVTRPVESPVVAPLSGAVALINPRVEDPLYYLFLDLLNTFAFIPRNGISPTEVIRANYTIEVLRLNIRDYLVEARRTAFGTYRARLVEYVGEKSTGASQVDLDRRKSELLKVGHQTVWREMQRQHSVYPVLSGLFSAAPEALGW